MKALEIAKSMRESHEKRKRELWQRIQTEDPVLSDLLINLNERFGPIRLESYTNAKTSDPE